MPLISTPFYLSASTVLPFTVLPYVQMALDKNPGVCPIGVGETVWRIIGKAIITALKTNL